MINDIEISINRLLHIHSNFKKSINTRFKYMTLINTRKKVENLYMKIEKLLATHLSEITDNQFNNYISII